MHRLAFLLIGTFTMALPLGAFAQSGPYPQRPIRLIVGFPPGGTTDVVGRMIAGKLSERLGQQVVVDNRPGASGIIGARIVARSQPDGYTMLISGASISIAGSLLTETKFDVQRELEPLALVTTSPYVMVAHPGIGVKTVSELIAYAKPRAGKLSYSAGSPGSVQHLSGEMLKRNAGIDMVFIPYKGSGALLQDILAGNLQVVFDSALLLGPHIKSGALRALAVTSAKRSPILPDVPSLAEAGVQGIDASGWQSMFVAPKTPPEIVKKLNTEILAIVTMPEIRDRLLALGATPVLGTPDDLRKLLAREVPAWRKVIQDAAIKAE